MSLADFIEGDLPGLIDDWAEYALALSQEGSQLSETQLRDSAADILTSIAADMRDTQSPLQQQNKSRGDNRELESSFDRVAHLHAEDRLSHGFGINDVVAEFRALRATVLRRWQKISPDGAAAFQEMIRFNEAIDQVIAESVRHYASRTERIRDLFAGVLAHDLRSPLGAILNSIEVLLHDENLSPASVRAVAFVQRGAMRMKQMIDDLLIFTRTRLGDAMPVSFTPQDMGRICGDAADEVRASGSVPAKLDEGSADQGRGCITGGLWKAKNRGNLIPMIIMLHGADQHPDDFAAGTRMNVAAEEGGFIVAYPEQPESTNLLRCWNWFIPSNQARDKGETAALAALTNGMWCRDAAAAGGVRGAGWHRWPLPPTRN